MKIVEINERTPSLIQRLIDIWDNSIRATHLFLSDSEIKMIREYVPQALKVVPHLIVAENEDGVANAFMGIDGQTLEMLFVSDGERGKGWGKKLIEYGMKAYSISRLAVNEQNPLAKGFYEHMGFHVYERAERDEQGNPYPLLYMRLN